MMLVGLNASIIDHHHAAGLWCMADTLLSVPKQKSNMESVFLLIDAIPSRS